MVFLLAVEVAAPLPVADGVGAVADVLPRQGTRFTFIQIVVDGCPVHMAGLRFHDPEILLLEAACQVIGRTIFVLVDVTLADVIIPGGQIEILGDGVMIVAIKPAHHIGGDELAGCGVSRMASS